MRWQLALSTASRRSVYATSQAGRPRWPLAQCRASAAAFEMPHPQAPPRVGLYGFVQVVCSATQLRGPAPAFVFVFARAHLFAEARDRTRWGLLVRGPLRCLL